MRLIMIDNYDSFTYNLVQLFREFDIEVLVFRHDETSIPRMERLKPDWVCISPGPKNPFHSGISKAVVEVFGPRTPLLGVCLGMQVINEVFGGTTLKAPTPVHGKRSLVEHHGEGILAGIPSPFRVARYHSLRIDPSSPFIKPVAFADDGVIMAIGHISWPLWGVQFHPESFMTEYGLELIRNFLALHPHWVDGSTHCVCPEDRFPRFYRGPGAPSSIPMEESI